jgi:hypothetical protein
MGFKEALQHLVGQKKTSSSLSGEPTLLNKESLEEKYRRAVEQKATIEEQKRQEDLKLAVEENNIYKEKREILERLAEQYTTPLAIEFNRLPPFSGRGEVYQRIHIESERHIENIVTSLVYKIQDTDDDESGYKLSFRIDANTGDLGVKGEMFDNFSTISNKTNIRDPNWKRNIEDAAIDIILKGECLYHYYCDSGYWVADCSPKEYLEFRHYI